MKKIIVFFLVISLTSMVFCQTIAVQPTTLNPENNSEADGFLDLENQLYKTEIASFNLISKIIEFKGKTDVKSIPISSFTKDMITFLYDNLKVEIKISAFEPNSHEYKYIDPEAPFLVKVDGKAFYGTDGTLPTTQISSLKIEINKQNIPVPAIEFSDLFEPKICQSTSAESDCFCKVFQSKDAKRMYVYMRNGEGAAAYEVTWVFENNKYIRRVVDFVY